MAGVEARTGVNLDAHPVLSLNTTLEIDPGGSLVSGGSRRWPLVPPRRKPPRWTFGIQISVAALCIKVLRRPCFERRAVTRTQPAWEVRRGDLPHSDLLWRFSATGQKPTLKATDTSEGDRSGCRQIQ